MRRNMPGWEPENKRDLRQGRAEGVEFGRTALDRVRPRRVQL
jgi:hypothetical protein